MLRLYGRRLERSGSWTTDIDRGIGVRVYSDTRPHNLDVAPIQKGLVLLLGEKELIDEGVGFGAPVVDYADRCFFSSDAQTAVSDKGREKIITKIFEMNTVSRKQLSGGLYVDGRLFNLVSTRLTDAYRAGGIRPQFNLIMRLQKMLNIHTRFLKTETRGDVKLTYRIRRRTIDVEVDLTKLKRDGCRRIIISNEQGSAFFRTYQDSSGLILRDDQIGPWEKVQAATASLSDIHGNLTFELEDRGDAELFRGREVVEGRFAWAGLDYTLDPSIDKFEYSAKFRRRFLDKPATLLTVPK